MSYSGPPHRKTQPEHPDIQSPPAEVAGDRNRRFDLSSPAGERPESDLLPNNLRRSLQVSYSLRALNVSLLICPNELRIGGAGLAMVFWGTETINLIEGPAYVLPITLPAEVYTCGC